ncbi:hypothetical protein CALCODRAFT_547130 [Calocera cornea HHB12733]|uniref:CxC6 like cysteine cluster associated with KDZ domain-containing protein n=1 Tax=Calocera cornea HHB12733 TaxID=1353952 RepID=A0A165EJ23_9BASI|nr:hypothetical protein CALCODRAFT_547130 [Calocera cornea HHB12733]
MNVFTFVVVLWRLRQLLGGVSVQQVLEFCAFSRRLQPRIAWQELTHVGELDAPPKTLPQTVAVFLATAINVSPAQVSALWSALREVVWLPRFNPTTLSVPLVDDFSPFARLAQSFSLGEQPLYNPTKHYATLYTLGRGAFPALVVALHCRSCKATYHLNYYREHTEQGSEERVYYEGLPDVVQAEKHMLFEKQLCELFRAQTVHAHSSATANARTYDQALRRTTARSIGPYDPSPLRGEWVSDLFDLFALLLHHSEQRTLLRLPEDGHNQAERLFRAMQERNSFIARKGQPQWAHACNLCLKVLGPPGDQKMIHCAVTDGISIGRPCCAVHNCPLPLTNNRAHFCAAHAQEEELCAVQGCNSPRQSGRLTCGILEHRALEDKYKAPGKSFIQLTHRHRQAYERGGEDGEEVVEMELEEEEEGEQSEVVQLDPMPRRESKKKVLRARFGRNRTHNEQLVVRPCGVIVGRGTFYGAEALGSVIDFIMSIFPTLSSMPDLLFFDNNCNLRRHLENRAEEVRRHFEHTLLVVDAFHWDRKHKLSRDQYCSMHCNPAVYPELCDETKPNKWLFNSSACEQANAWLRKFAAQTREMTAVRFEFFLDEVIKAHNEHIVLQLRRANHFPHHIPASNLA